MLSKPYFHDEQKAYAFLESVIWANGRACPHCGVLDKSGPLKGATTRIGLYKCYACRKTFTVTVGTVFERSKVPLNRWLQAAYLLCASKKGFSAHQLHRVLDVQYKTAWFMFHRLREAMRSGDLSIFGGSGGAVEADETFIGNDRTVKPKGVKRGRGYAHKHKVLALIDRGPPDGESRPRRVCSG